MSNYKNLYKLIDGLNIKIKKLELVKNSDNNINNNKSIIESYSINHPKENSSSKKYIGLLFSAITDDYESEDNIQHKNLFSFIKLLKSNIVINYTLHLEINFTSLDSIICSIALGIKTKSDSKIKIIKGTKHFFDLANTNINNKVIISNTILYSCETNDELCMVVDFGNNDFGNNCLVNYKKSVIKILYI